MRVIEVPALRFQVRECDPELVHALRAVGREPGVVLLHAPRIAEHLREVEVTAAVIALVGADRIGVGLARRVAPERVGRDDGIGGVFVDGVAQRQRHAAFRRLDVVLADVRHAFVVLAEPEPPLGLDRARRCGLEHLDDFVAGALGDLGERRLGGGRGAGIAVPVQHHVGAPAVVRERRRLSLRKLERRYVGGWRGRGVRRQLLLDNVGLIHGVPPAERAIMAYGLGLWPRVLLDRHRRSVGALDDVLDERRRTAAHEAGEEGDRLAAEVRAGL